MPTRMTRRVLACLTGRRPRERRGVACRRRTRKLRTDVSACEANYFATRPVLWHPTVKMHILTDCDIQSADRRHSAMISCSDVGARTLDLESWLHWMP